MKDWCKHRYGFVNFDDEFMYFTSSGNWSDVDDLGELNESGYRSKSVFERNKAGLFLILLILVGALLFWITGFRIQSSAIIFTLFAIFAVFNYLSTSFTMKFKVPYSKIQSIEVGEQTADISFTDFNGKEEKQHVQGLYSKGIGLFCEVSDNYLSKSSEMEESDPTNWEV